MQFHTRLRSQSTTDGRVNFYEHISKVKKEAASWLDGVKKNGIDYSQRLEGYLDRLIPDAFKKKLKPAEVCFGHAHESVCPLRAISPDFGDQCLCEQTLNLRRLAALLRLADEMDQAYIRLGHPLCLRSG